MSYIHLLLLLFCIIIIDSEVVDGLETESIIGGEEAEIDQIKYQVSLQDGWGNVCGGCIIEDEYVLTAAHCLVDNQNQFKKDITWLVVAGVVDAAVSYTKNFDIEIEVEKIFIPKQYIKINPDPNQPFRSVGDIAVLKLKERLGLGTNPKLSKLKLPEMPYSSYNHKRAVVSGFGWNWVKVTTDPKTGEQRETGGSRRLLRFAKAKIIPNKKCKQFFIKPIESSHLCASVVQRNITNQLEGVCHGDSGSPLVYDNTVIGIVSSSPMGCHENVQPAVYTRVSSYVDFIKAAITNHLTPDIRVADLTNKIYDD